MSSPALCKAIPRLGYTHVGIGLTQGKVSCAAAAFIMGADESREDSKDREVP